ncbi:hypothetical protein C1645_839075 [Glomus cerebriforme]|uniref:Uncharacterized protein n=1 Tax=Glomus cerebriforme TaxID=658196 RepID=A0A397S896_9GLOM|nr:hypothetical protein C1645_839075 [Glomus cerebriforme]
MSGILRFSGHFLDIINVQKKPTKVITINFDSEDNCDDNNEDNKKNSLNFNEFEYQERDLALKEREIALREREAKRA